MSISRLNRNQGFTLLELLVVIFIIGLLTVTLLIVFDGTRERSRDAKRIIDLSNIKIALELYYEEYNAYPCPPGGACEPANPYPVGGNPAVRSNEAQWATLETMLSEYIYPLPIDPKNTPSCKPEDSESCHAYVYANVFNTSQRPQYDLYAGFEDSNHERACGLSGNNYKIFYDDRTMCAVWIEPGDPPGWNAYNVNDLYEVSLD